ncbi:MAG: substrate-binding domain-containing protein [Nitrospirota bacterium]|nr:substrate-binding domain-containing protein [Nitrospirota bacterium]MDH5769387.1 substrate-binding domain-containing protein [Nitrospirota bacterium]
MNKILVSLTMLIFLFALSFNASAEEIKVGAGQAPTVNILKPIKQHFEKATGINLVIITGSPKSALIILEKGNVKAALGGLSFEDWMKYMKQEGAEIKDPSALQHVVVGKDKIKVLIHKDNPVSKLTKEQLKGIFTGKIMNWKDVGGKDMPIIVVWTKLFGGNFIFTKKILDGAFLRKDISEVENSSFTKAHVALTPAAIAIGPLGIVDDTIKSPETPEVSRPITLITKGKPSPNVQKLIDFIKGEGHEYIKQ